MKRSKAFRHLALAAAVVGTPALAAKMLYIRSKDTQMVKKADPKAPAVTKLQPGTEVEWLGADEKNKMFHKVKAGGKEGYVLQVNLTASKPQEEKTSDGKSISAHAVASSGAATRALSEEGQGYAARNPDAKTAGQQVVLIEGINAAVKDKDVADHVAKASLPKGGK